MNCPVCYCEEVRVCLERYQEFCLNICLECDLAWWTPFKNPGPHFYEKICTLRDVCSFSDEEEYDHKEFIRNIPMTEGSLLDLGCGTGAYLKRIREKGFSVAGIDFNRRAIETARNRYGLKETYVMSVEEFSHTFSKRTFNMVTAFQVLEHLDDPRGFILSIKRVLKPGGYLVLSIPNRERWLQPQPMPNYLYGAKGDYPPPHLTRWNKKALTYLLRSQGFDVLEMKISPVSMAEAREFFTRQISFINRSQAALVTRLMNSKRVNRASGRKALAIEVFLSSLRKLRKVLLCFLVWPIFLYARIEKKQGCFLYAVARLAEESRA